MATLYWKGQANPVRQITTATPGGTIGTNTFTLTVGNHSVSYAAATGNTATNVATNLANVWNSSTHPYFIGITATASTDVITLTADTAGVPFEVTASTSGVATFTINTTTQNDGPNVWSTPANWSTDMIPNNGDIVVFENGSVPVFWGLEQSAITLAELHVRQSYTGKIGLPDAIFTVSQTITDESKSEYRQTYLKIGATMIRIGEQATNANGNGSRRIKIDTGAIQTQLNVINSAATADEASLQPIRWIGQHAANQVNLTRGIFGVATNLPGETATISQLNVSQQGNLSNDASIQIASGVTVGTINQSGGQIALDTSATTINQTAGTLTTQGAGVITTATIGGTAYLNSTGIITTLIVNANGQADFSRDPQARTVTNCQVYRSANLNLNNGNPLSIAMTTGIDFIHCEPKDVTLNVGPHLTANLSVL